MASPEIKNLAQQLIALQAARVNTSEAHPDASVQVVGELGRRLIKLAGVDGFRALLSRALSLAKAETTSLHTVQIGADGSLEGFGDLDRGEKVGAARAVLVAHVLELLVTFIGKSLTLGLVRDAWPSASLAEVDSRTEEKH